MAEAFSTYLRSGQSVQNGDIIDVIVGVGGLFLEIFVAGDYLGEVDVGGDEDETEEEAGDDGYFELHDYGLGNDRLGERIERVRLSENARTVGKCYLMRVENGVDVKDVGWRDCL